MARKVVLIIDDDPLIRKLVAEHCEALGYESEQASTGVQGLELALENEYALIVLDLGLPKLGGHEVCREIRDRNESVPILVLTGESGEASTVLSLELGADEFISKPIKSLEFRARARALLRRAAVGGGVDNERGEKSQDSASGLSTFKDIRIDYDLREVYCEEVKIELTTSDFDLFAVFLSNPHRTLSKDELVNLLWGYSNYSSTLNVRTALSRLRTKLEAVGKRAPYIVTQRGYGYRLAKEDE